eukprot:CAMPEP_0179439408 /NCGR_PEP_ID=MMETSP0799-20121207/23043_1 /TAXON_ID=46947 /ORGANISM="Geminigera cryophila, Strain CCMP2564" /LENGTH=276 /DNA_ID=CAMNT_0021221799 /DNA_START=85 /DNA_END=911 /DNA_ORIENTATION=+
MTVIRVPRKMLLVGDDVVDSNYKKAIENKKRYSDVLLAVRILEERAKGNTSEWFPYLSELPTYQEYTTFHPMAASQSEIARFQALPTVQRVRAKKEEIKRVFHFLGVDKKWEWEAFWYAYITYISRAYGITIKAHDGTEMWMAAIGPFADLANTISPQSTINSKWQYSQTLQEFQVITTEAVAAGHELYESYQISSIKDNSFLAYMFGFTLANNRKQVQQLGSTACRKMLHPRQEEATSKISQLLYSLAVEHCVATGEVLEADTDSSTSIKSKTGT